MRLKAWNNFWKESELALLVLASVITTISAVIEKLFLLIKLKYAFHIFVFLSCISLARIGFTYKTETSKTLPLREIKSLKYGKGALIARILLVGVISIFLVFVILDMSALSPGQKQALNDNNILGEFFLERKDWQNALEKFEESLKIDRSNKRAKTGYEIAIKFIDIEQE